MRPKLKILILPFSKFSFISLCFCCIRITHPLSLFRSAAISQFWACLFTLTKSILLAFLNILTVCCLKKCIISGMEKSQLMSNKAHFEKVFPRKHLGYLPTWNPRTLYCKITACLTLLVCSDGNDVKMWNSCLSR